MIEFSGVDLVVRRAIDDDDVRRALAVALGVPLGRVAVIDDVSDYPDTEAADVVCVCSALEGEFARVLSIQVERLTLPYDTRAQLIQRLSELLGTQCLVPEDDDVNPYFMWLVSPGGAPAKIGLDPAALDEGRYVIVSS